MTTSKYTKRQHTVPRVYLKRFGETKKKETFIYALDKSKKDSVPFRINIKKVCVETDYYTLDSLTVDKKLILEDFFSKNIEDYYDEVYKILTNPKVNSISDDNRFRIIASCVSQFFRTPKLSNQFNTFWNRIINFSYDMLESNTETKIVDFGHVQVDTSLKDRDEFIKEETESNKEMNLKNTVNQIADLILRRMNDGISIKKMHPKHKLITSDNPVYSGEHIYDPDCFIRMPIDESHLLILIPGQEMANKIISRQSFDEHWSFFETLANNAMQFKLAERFVLGSAIGLNDFLKLIAEFNKEEVQERFKN